MTKRKRGRKTAKERVLARYPHCMVPCEHYNYSAAAKRLRGKR